MATIETLNRALLISGSDGTSRTARTIGLLFMVLAIISVGVTFAVLTGLTRIEPTQDIIQVSLIVNSLLVAGLIGSIGWEIRTILIARRRGRAAARLHVRIVTLFSIIAAIPAILIAVVASITLDQGLDRWFEQRTRQIVDNALTVAQAYVQEHGHVLRADLMAMAADVDRAKPVYNFEPSRFDKFFETQASLRSVPAAFLLKRDGTVLMRTILPGQRKFPLPPEKAYEEADKEQPVIIAPGISNMVGGLMKLQAYDDMYLFVVRAMDPRVIEYLRIAQNSAADFNSLEGTRFGVQVAFALVYIGVSLVLLLSSTWLGFGFANRLVAPIRRLIGAAGQVSRGNLYVQVPTDRRYGDLADLGSTFNTMTSELRGQRNALLAANDQIDRRRRFTEAVLAGVTSGVIGIDENGVITLLNRSALTLLDAQEAPLIGERIDVVIPELASFIEDSLSLDIAGSRQTQITMVRGGLERIVNIRLTTEDTEVREHGFVITLDDITDLVAAQRNTAWADVARRIAHEIKNPLTPIQLSAERIRRRYGKQIKDDDTKVFDQCVDTIVRQVGDIGRMVDEFSSFARMPEATKAEKDLAEIIREGAFMQSVANPEIEYDTNLPDAPATAWLDHRLVGQAITNVIKNASESVSAVTGRDNWSGKIRIDLREENEGYVIDIIDNGLGLPAENRQRLLEPYMTTREKGTGLGLAIVRKIMEEHGGGIELLDAPEVADGGQGALIRLRLAKSVAAEPDDQITEKIAEKSDG
ncbi:MAG: PAS domain-containing sensor histidine kinase [Stappiaceae bacterium]